MKTFDEFSRKVNEAYKNEKDITKIAKEMKCSRLEVIEALGFSDEWSNYFDEC